MLVCTSYLQLGMDFVVTRPTLTYRFSVATIDGPKREINDTG